MRAFIAQNAGRGGLTVRLDIDEATLIKALGQPVRVGDAAYDDDDGKVPMFWNLPSTDPGRLPRIWSYRDSHVMGSFSCDLQGEDIARFETFVSDVVAALKAPAILYYWKGGTEVGSWIPTLAEASPQERRKIERMGYVTRVARIAPLLPPTAEEINGVLGVSEDPVAERAIPVHPDHPDAD